MHAALTVRVGAALSQKRYAYDTKHVPRWGNKHPALTVRVGAALSQKIYAYDAKHVPRWGNKPFAPNSKIQLNFITSVRMFVVLFLKCRISFSVVVQNSQFLLKYSLEIQQVFSENIKSPLKILEYPRISQRKLLNFQKMVFGNLENSYM